MEIIIGWLPLLLVFLAVFFVLRKQKTKEDRTKDVVLKIISVGLCIVVNVLLSALLHWLIMDVFYIDTSGFINLNELFVYIASWVVVSLLFVVLIRTLKDRLGNLYKTFLITQIICFVIPFLCLFVFLLVAGMK